MQLSDNDIQEFLELWQQEFGESISFAEARHYASHLLELYRIIAESLKATSKGTPT